MYIKFIYYGKDVTHIIILEPIIYAIAQIRIIHVQAFVYERHVVSGKKFKNMYRVAQKNRTLQFFEFFHENNFLG